MTTGSTSFGNRAGRTGPGAGLVIGFLLLTGCAGERFTAPQATEGPSAQDQIALARRLASEAQTADREKRTDDAIALYQQSIQAYRQMPAAWHNLGVLYMSKGDNIQAAEAFKAAADLSPTDPRPLFNIGVIWERQGYLKDAAKYYNEALQREENFLPALEYSILLDHSLNTSNEVTEERLKRALLLEKNPEWRKWFEKEQIRLANRRPEAAPQGAQPRPRRTETPAPLPLPGPTPSPPVPVPGVPSGPPEPSGPR